METGDDKSELIADIEKSPDERIRVKRTVFKGVDYVDIRIYYDASSADEPDSWKPTKKGIALKPELVQPLIEALQKAAA